MQLGRSSLCALMLMAGAAVADEDALAAVPDADRALLEGMVSVVCIDVHPSQGCEPVALLQNSQDPQAADVVVFANRDAGPSNGPLLVALAAAYLGTGEGGAPFIGDGRRMDFVINSQETDFGRHPWFKELHIGWRDDRFVVLSQVFNSYDRATGETFYCDVNRRFGAYEITVENPEANPALVVSQSGEATFETIETTDGWGYLGLPAVCDEAANVYYN